MSPHTIAASIVNKKLVAGHTHAVTFRVPPSFSFLPGQYITVTIPSLHELPTKEQFRDFSIASSPEELPLLTIAFRDSGSVFKKTLLNMEDGASVALEGPKGVFVLPERSSVPVVCIAGGMGITAFRGSIKYAALGNNPSPLTLISINTDETHAPFLEELREYSKTLKTYFFFGQPTPAPMLEYIRETDVAHALYYLAGPVSFVIFIRTLLLSLHITEDRIHTEEFTGYA